VEPGELSVVADELSILTKSLLPLPDKWHGLADVEKRYRQVLLTQLLRDVLGQHLGRGELVKLPGTCRNLLPEIIRCGRKRTRDAPGWQRHSNADSHGLMMLLLLSSVGAAVGRQRYLDLIVSDETRATFRARSKVISAIRRHLEDQGFLEVSSPPLVLRVVSRQHHSVPYLPECRSLC
jgi:hypothetical protein